MVSVIIPIYNAEKYLRECFDSVFNQTIKTPYEVIAVLCPSKDKSKEIVQEYCQKYANLTMIELSEINGPAITRLKGVEVAKGKYISFLDSDDFYHQDFLKVMRDTIEKEDCDIVSCNFYSYVDGKAKKYKFASNKKLNSVRTTKAMLWDTSLRSFLWNKMFKRELFENLRLYYPKRKDALFEDSAVFASIILKIQYLKMVKQPLNYYRVNPNSLTQVVNKERFNYHLYTFALIRHLCDLRGEKYAKAFRKTYYRSWWSLYYDALLLKKENGHGPFKHMRLNKKNIKKLKSKKPLPIEGEVWESYIKECF